MRRAILMATLLAASCASLQMIDDAQLGLSKGSVFEQVAPMPFGFDTAAAKLAPLAGSGMPPMISHAIDEYLPITSALNSCTTCHHRPAAIGKPVAQGQAAPVPSSHYVKRGADLTLAGANYVCTGCHAPQSGVKPLVDNRSR